MTTPRLFLRFALFSGVALVAAVLVGLLLARWNANDRARSRAIGEARAVATQLGRDDLARTAFQWPRAGGSSNAGLVAFLDDFFSPTTAGHEPAKVVLYSPQGYVTYATDRDLIGTQPRDDAGRLHTALDSPQYTVAHGVQETFVPVTWSFAPDAASGVMQLEHDYAPIAQEIHDDFIFQAATIALALLGLYLAMLPIMRRVTRSLRRGYIERAQLAAIVDHSNDAIIGQAPDGRITSWNEGAVAAYGWTAEEAIGKSIDMLLPEHEEEPASGFDLARATHVRKDGMPVSVSVTVSPVRDESGAFVGSSMIARDVTELKRMDQELREAHRQEAVGRLAGGLAHDFGAVLGAIETAATNLLLAPEVGAAAQRELEKIRRATAQGSSLADQLLAVGGVQEAQPELLDLNEAVEAAGPRLAELAGPHVAVATELDPALGQVSADRAQIEQLILNLAANARDSMPAGGRITIETRNVDFSRRTRDGDDQGHHVMFAVSDTGAGLSEEAATRPFEPFLRRSESGERMALGLAAVCGIVKQSGGTMGVDSRPEGGTVIRVYLPRAAVGQPAAATSDR